MKNFQKTEDKIRDLVPRLKELSSGCHIKNKNGDVYIVIEVGEDKLKQRQPTNYDSRYSFWNHYDPQNYMDVIKVSAYRFKSNWFSRTDIFYLNKDKSKTIWSNTERDQQFEIIGHPITLDDVSEAIDAHYTIAPPKECVFLYWERRGAIIKMKKKGRYNNLICAYLGRTFLVNFGKYNLKPTEVTDPETRSSDPIFLEILDFYKKNLKQKVSEKWKNGKCFIDQPKETKEFITDILKKNEV